MSEYSEIIKKLNQVRDCMRDFYIYGFQSRQQLQRRLNTSGRSYDTCRRRIESYLADCMAFRQDKEGKRVFLSVDSASIAENPLYRAFKAKTFTRNDLFLHFAVISLLQDGNALTAAQLLEKIDALALAEGSLIDISTLRKKLKEYVALGLLEELRQGKQIFYRLTEDPVDAREFLRCQSLQEALHFFAQTTPLGVVGSYIQDWLKEGSEADSSASARLSVQDMFCWKHRYIVHALESEIVSALLEAMHEKRAVQVQNFSEKTQHSTTLLLLPLRLLSSVQSGRRYLAAYDYRFRHFRAYRLDYIKDVKTEEPEVRYATFQQQLDEMLFASWGVAFSRKKKLETLCMVVEVLAQETHILQRIQREGRGGSLTRVDERHWRYEIEVWDALEMLPWLRTFTGRIASLHCTNEQVVRRFFQDLEQMYQMYEIEGPQSGKVGGAL